MLINQIHVIIKRYTMTNYIIKLFIYCLVYSTTHALDRKPFDDTKCRAISMRGGGTKGAYEVGVFKAMVERLNSREVMYDFCEGVSIGAMNCAFIASTPKGHEAEAIKLMERLWLSYPAKEMWGNWPIFGLLASLWKPSFLETTKFKDMMNKFIDANPEFYRAISFQAVDLNTG